MCWCVFLGRGFGSSHPVPQGPDGTSLSPWVDLDEAEHSFSEDPVGAPLESLASQGRVVSEPRALNFRQSEPG